MSLRVQEVCPFQLEKLQSLNVIICVLRYDLLLFYLAIFTQKKDHFVFKTIDVLSLSPTECYEHTPNI